MQPGRGCEGVPSDGVASYVSSTELRQIIVEGGVVRRPGGADGAVTPSCPEEPPPRTGAGELAHKSNLDKGMQGIAAPRATEARGAAVFNSQPQPNKERGG
jgi:hypothetical protein